MDIKEYINAIKDKFVFPTKSFILILTLFISITTCGLIVFFSSVHNTNDLYEGYFRGREYMFFFGLILCFMFFLIPLKIPYKHNFFLFWMSMFFLVLPFIFYIIEPESQLGGGIRWIYIGGYSLQPSELSKIVISLFIAKSALINRYNLNEVKNKKFFSNYIMACLVAVLIILQRDLSTAIVLLFSLLITFFLVDISMRYFFLMICISVFASIFFIVVEPFRLSRMLNFIFTVFNSQKADNLGVGYQSNLVSKILNTAGMFGKGYLNGEVKNNIPEIESDFIFAVPIEEFGFFGAMALFLLFMGFFVMSYNKLFIQKRENLYAFALGINILNILLVQFLIHVLVVMGGPVTGLPLPFFSWGNTNYLINFMLIGLLFNAMHKPMKILRED